MVISQPRYLPTICYLQRLHFSELFVFLDNVQRQPRGWENRNIILLNGKKRWLTIPIASSSRTAIKDSIISGHDWIKSHQDLIHTAYSKHPNYDRKIVAMYFSGIKKIILNLNCNFSEVLIKLTLNACKIFDFKPNIVRASDYPSSNRSRGPKKLLRICRETKATKYISGSNGREYGIKKIFRYSKTKVLFHDYKHPTYKQYGQKKFVPWLSFFDPLFNLGLKEVKKWVYQKPILSEK